jgi:Rieske Fe-S protein
MPREPLPDSPLAPHATQRRAFLSSLPSLAMAGGLAAGYGGFAAIAGRFLYPAKPGATVWQFITGVARMKPGDALLYTMPAGTRVTVTRQGDTGGGGDFLALSSTCPHLGCQVRWEPQNGRFFCPCHNGTFDPSGRATGGPPAEAGQSLPRYSLKVVDGLLFIEVPLEPMGSIAGTSSGG